MTRTSPTTRVRRKRKDLGSTVVYRAQSGVLVAGFVLATLLLMLAPDARGPMQSAAGPAPAHAPHSEEELPAVHAPELLPKGTERPLGETESRYPRSSFLYPKAAPEADRTYRAASPPSAEEPPSPPPVGKGGEGFPSEVASPLPPGSCEDPLALVDREHSLPRDYAPQDLMPLASYGVRMLRENALLRREAAESLSRLMEAADAAGEDLIVASAYRSYGEQQELHAEFLDFYGQEADTISARPGHSEHQLGVAVDFTNAEAGYMVGSAFEGTSAYAWLLEHAQDHGFVQSYEEGKEEETGYQAEPWHYRYIGVEDARRLKGTELSLGAFLLREGVLPSCD